MKYFLFGAALTLMLGLGAYAADGTVIEQAGINPECVPAGKSVKVTYKWSAKPMGKDYKVFVHIRDANGEMVGQDDHTPPWPTKTSDWHGNIVYTRQVRVPGKLVEGEYRLLAGLYDKEGKQVLQAGTGVKEADKGMYEIGKFVVDRTAPPPPLDSDKPKTLNLTGYKLTFSDEFDSVDTISAWGPLDGEKKKWISHKPDGGSFGDSLFMSQKDGFPFVVENGVLRIEAKKVGNQWQSGLICSNDPKGRGFAQKYGYFEMRAKFPEGAGVWPAFWLLSQKSASEKVGLEIDIIEEYGHQPEVFCATYHWWFTGGGHRGVGNSLTVTDMSKDFHNYGFMWNEREMIWYFDGVELWRQLTPDDYHVPFYVLANLALGSGWPIDKVPNPSYMYIDYIRVYVKE